MNIQPPQTGSSPAPGPDAPGSPAVGPAPPTLADAHEMAKARYAKTAAADSILTSIRTELDQLTKLGDTVTSEDVIQSAGRLVASGATPMEMASLLADMPEGGQALANWIAQQDQAVTQREAQVAPLHALARHQVGVTGLHSLMQQMQAGPSAGPAPLPMTGGAVPNA